jgi:hypothetical protein
MSADIRDCVNRGCRFNLTMRCIASEPILAVCGNKLYPKRCDQCEAARINGIFCHETGCPNIRKVWNPVDGTWDEPDREED